MPTNEQWWESLTPQWRQAFRMACLQNEADPSEEALSNLRSMVVLRLVGPGAPHPNCNFQLTDLSGVKELNQLQILIVTHHALRSIAEVAMLPQLKSLFVLNNHIESLQGIGELHQLEQLHVQCNELRSIQEVEGLLQLTELYVSDNKITSLAGLTEKHGDRLKKFVCLPNEFLKQKEIIYTERELGIMCR